MKRVIRNMYLFLQKEEVVSKCRHNLFSYFIVGLYSLFSMPHFFDSFGNKLLYSNCPLLQIAQ